MKRDKVYKIAWSGFFIALGILFPMMFHLVGLGKTFLPMHIPVLLAGFFLGPGPGAIVGLITPILSALLTGMPPLSPPIAQAMMVELAVYASLAGLLYVNLKKPLIPSLLVSMIGGRLVYGFLGWAILPLFGFEKVSVWYPLTAGLLASLPGIILQLVSVPIIVRVVERQAPSFGLAKGESR